MSREIARQCSVLRSSLGIRAIHEFSQALHKIFYKEKERTKHLKDVSRSEQAIERPDNATQRNLNTSKLKEFTRKDSTATALTLETRLRAEKGDKKKWDKRIRAMLDGLKESTVSQDLERGRRFHQEAIEAGYDSNVFVATAIVTMYSNCGKMVEARKVFERILHHDLASWNALIHGYVKNYDDKEALKLFEAMKVTGTPPNSRTLVAVLMAYTHQATREQGRWLELLEKGITLYCQADSHVNVFVAAAMVDLCAKCKNMKQAREVFDSIHVPDVSLWNVLILGYVENGENEVALRLFQSMQHPRPDARTVMAVLLACGNLAGQEETTRIDGRNLKVVALQLGMTVHSVARKIGCDKHNFVANCLIDMYSRCGNVVEARRVFDGMTNWTVVSWTAMIVGYELNLQGEVALDLFSQMRSVCEPDERAVVAALAACASLACKEVGQLVDDKLVKLESLQRGMAILSQARSVDMFIETSLIDLYAKCGCLADARKVFDGMHHQDIAAWNALIAGHAEAGESEKALDFFQQMQVQAHCEPNSTTLVAAITACSDLASKEEGTLNGDQRLIKSGALEKGAALHRLAKKWSCELDISVANALLEMYARCGSLEDLWTVFNGLHYRNTSSWTTLMMGHVECGDAKTVLELFDRMQVEDRLVPKVWTFACAFKACTTLFDLQTGRSLHAGVYRKGVEDSLTLDTAIMDFYGKCGSVSRAQYVFDSLVKRDTPSWNSLLTSYSIQGDFERFFEIFDHMLRDGSVAPNATTFICLLSTCSHTGRVDEGKKYFHSMKDQFDIEPSLEHYNCMVDMLGRANKLDQALEIVKAMPYEATAMTWRTLLSACQTWKNVEVGKLAFDALTKLDENGPSGYVLMSNIYSSQTGS